MRAFNYVWSLPITWQRWRSHHSVRRSRKPNDTRKPHGSVFYRTEVKGDRSSTLRDQVFSTFFAPVTLTLTFIYELDPNSLAIHRICKYVNALESYRLINRQTRPKLCLYTTPLRGWSTITMPHKYNWYLLDVVRLWLLPSCCKPRTDNTFSSCMSANATSLTALHKHYRGSTWSRTSFIVCSGDGLKRQLDY